MSKTTDNHDNKDGFDRMGAHALAPLRIGDNGFELMTESELITYLRVPEVSKSKDYHIFSTVIAVDFSFAFQVTPQKLK